MRPSAVFDTLHWRKPDDSDLHIDIDAQGVWYLNSVPCPVEDDQCGTFESALESSTDKRAKRTLGPADSKHSENARLKDGRIRTRKVDHVDLLPFRN